MSERSFNNKRQTVHDAHPADEDIYPPDPMEIPAPEAGEENYERQSIYEDAALEAEETLTIDLVRQYLNTIGRIPLLTAEQEVELAHSIEAGLLAEEKLQAKGTGHYDPDDLEMLVLLGQQAKEKMINSNLKLAVSWAKRYLGKGLPLLDLIQAANLGLIRAVEKFDYTKGYKFSTYASWWIRQALQRVLSDESRNIRIPVHYVEQINKYKRTKSDLIKILEREPTDIEIAKAMKVEVEKVEEIAAVIAMEPVSIHSGVGEDAEFGDFIMDVYSDTTASAETSFLQTLLEEVYRVAKLSNQEREILELRYGLKTGTAMNHKEIAQEYGFTENRSHQIVGGALTKIKNAAKSGNPHITELREYMS